MTKNLSKTQNWHLLNADGQVLGRLATQAATILMGKHDPSYVSNQLSPDAVVVINAEKVKVTGRKAEQKEYHSYSGYPGGLKTLSFERAMKKDPCMPVKKAIQGMLPKSNLGSQMKKRLFVYAGDQHPHAAQNPLPIAQGNK